MAGPSKFVIDGYPIDVQIRFEGRYESEVTKFPVEKGSDPTDNIRQRPRVIDVEGVVSSTPIGAIALDPTRASLQGSKLPPTDAYQRMIAIWTAKRYVTVQTTRDTYQNMAMTSFVDTIESGEANSLMFQATFEEIVIVDTQRVTVNSIQHQGLGFIAPTIANLNAFGKFVLSKVRESDFAGYSYEGNADTGTPIIKYTKHIPVNDSIYGSPVLSTTHEDRIATNGYDPFPGLNWVDHYIIPGITNDESDKKRTLVDGYIQTLDQGVNQAKGYYAIALTRSQAPTGSKQTNSAPTQNYGDGTVRNSSGQSITQAPPAPSNVTTWNHLAENDGT
jgi:hypothetical protein